MNAAFSPLKKFISYFKPVYITQVDSEHSEQVFLYLYKAELMLCTHTATYSHGLAYTPFSKAFQQLFKRGNFNPKRFLLLGGGLAAAPFLLFEKYKCLPQTTVVELEPHFKALAQAYLPAKLWENITWHTKDAFDYINNCTAQFDLIGIDLFLHLGVLEKSFSVAFLKQIKICCQANAVVIINTYFEDATQVPAMKLSVEAVFNEVVLIKNDRNYIVLARN